MSVRSVVQRAGCELSRRVAIALGPVAHATALKARCVGVGVELLGAYDASSTRQLTAPISGSSTRWAPHRTHCAVDGGLSLPCLMGAGAFWQATGFTGSSILTGQPEVGTRAARLNEGGP